MNEFLTMIRHSSDRLCTALASYDWGSCSPSHKGRQYPNILIGYREAGAKNSHYFSRLGYDCPDDSYRVLDAKFGILIDNQSFMASLEGRDPSKMLYGGAVRLDDGSLLGATLQPEIGDHVLVFALALCMRKISRDTWLRFTDVQHPQVSDVLREKKITHDSYANLLESINRRVTFAINGDL